MTPHPRAGIATSVSACGGPAPKDGAAMVIAFRPLNSMRVRSLVAADDPGAVLTQGAQDGRSLFVDPIRAESRGGRGGRQFKRHEDVQLHAGGLVTLYYIAGKAGTNLRVTFTGTLL